MSPVPLPRRVFLACGATDMRKGFDGLAVLVQQVLSKNRIRAHPQTHLAGFCGFLQADAYAGYDGMYCGGVTEVACWAHFRRKVFSCTNTRPHR